MADCGPAAPPDGGASLDESSPLLSLLLASHVPTELMLVAGLPSRCAPPSILANSGMPPCMPPLVRTTLRPRPSSTVEACDSAPELLASGEDGRFGLLLPTDPADAPPSSESDEAQPEALRGTTSCRGHSPPKGAIPPPSSRSPSSSLLSDRARFRLSPSAAPSALPAFKMRAVVEGASSGAIKLARAWRGEPDRLPPRGELGGTANGDDGRS